MDDLEIRRSVLEAVIEQRLTPGARLTESALCAIYGAPRRTVERALVRLEAEGVVSVERNRGARVSRPSPRSAREIFSLRRLVEGEIARRLSGAIDASVRARLDASIAAERAAAEGRQDRVRVRHSGDFHVVLAEATGDEEMTGLVRRLVARTALVTQLYGATRSLDCWGHDHATLVEHLAAGRTAEALALMEGHLASIEASLRIVDDDPEETDLRAALLGR